MCDKTIFPWPSDPIRAKMFTWARNFVAREKNLKKPKNWK